MNRPTFEDFKKEAMADPEFKKEYEALAPIWELRKKLILRWSPKNEQCAKL